MIALVCFVLAVLASPFWSKGRVGRKNAAVQYQLALLGGYRQMPSQRFYTAPMTVRSLDGSREAGQTGQPAASCPMSPASPTCLRL
jgi:hypothetical protein